MGVWGYLWVQEREKGRITQLGRNTRTSKGRNGHHRLHKEEEAEAEVRWRRDFQDTKGPFSPELTGIPARGQGCWHHPEPLGECVGAPDPHCPLSARVTGLLRN